MNHHVTIIGIAGGTGSGKTTVVKKIAEALPPDFVSIVPLDSYYNDTTGMTDEARKAINFDHPDAFDWRLLIEQVNDLRQGKAIEQPTYSYILSNRLPETIHVEPKPVVIIEGIMVLFNKELRDMMDLKVFCRYRLRRATDPQHRARHDKSRTDRLDGAGPLPQGVETHSRAVYRTDKALCGHYRASGRRKPTGHRDLMSLYRRTRTKESAKWRKITSSGRPGSL